MCGIAGSVRKKTALVLLLCALVGVEAVGVRHCCADYLLQHLRPPTGGSGVPWKTVELREVTVLSPGSHLEGVRWKTDLVLLHWSWCDWIGTGECAARLPPRWEQITSIPQQSSFTGPQKFLLS